MVFASVYAQRSTRGNGRHVLPETFMEKYGRWVYVILLFAVTLFTSSAGMTVLYRAGLDIVSVALTVALFLVSGAMVTAMLILVSAPRDQR